MISCLILSCEEKKSNIEKVVQKETVQIELTQEQKDSIEEEKYWGYDTLLLDEYVSDNGNEIKLRGSQSRFLYRISVKSNEGFEKDFDIAENSYIANHSSILWDNDDFIFVRYGCGSPCWGGKVLSLNRDEEIRDFVMYIYEDSINNLVVFTDTLDWDFLILEDLSTGEQKKEKFDFCEKASIPHWIIDTVTFVEPRTVEVKYKSKGCEEIKKKKIKIEN